MSRLGQMNVFSGPGNPSGVAPLGLRTVPLSLATGPDDSEVHTR